MAGVLDGVRVLDFGRYIAGPFCGMLLGDMGAEVIRIDKLAGSEDRYLVPVAESGEGPLFLALNRNKMSTVCECCSCNLQLSRNKNYAVCECCSCDLY